jgi:septal ring factor EnvC (AmiA/AmiB activator)
VNYGHLLSASVFLITAAMAWANLSSRQDQSDARIANLERAQEQIRTEANRASQVIVRLDEKITSLDRILQRLETILDSQVLPRRAPAPNNFPAQGG